MGIFTLLALPTIVHLQPSVAQSAPQTQQASINLSCGNNLFAKAFTNNHTVQICNSGNEKYSMIIQSGSTGRSLATNPVDDGHNVFVAKAGTTTYNLNMSQRKLTIVSRVTIRKKPIGIPQYRTVTTVEDITALMMS
ncbi:hypothetical protein [Calothrix sp. UHCC 0171]|uniref:hypothetical protein n=1 Tax=Calothrix sp. UHCC 0171 TaxID=3110245 RepID=UPI002B205DCB|nr:hypothetical protein [Calothrix sp. UHCC 0171]MEA5571292.1 hypothetical protein [Calothrix sp. UHCC 0171]